MNVINVEDVELQKRKDALFVGTVHANTYVTDTMSRVIRVGFVRFGPGGKNVFHTHSNDQVLIITEGKGIVATEKEEVVAEPGMIFHIPGGEKHWHGATATTPMSHIVIAALPSKLSY
jgi:quercetin dioxygenase-like cupin family protein